MQNRKSQKGFSLIELMMVVVIIGVLAGVGIPQYQKFQMKARQSEVKSLLTSMYTSQKAFYAEWNQYYADFNAVGYGLNGTLGYHVTFGAAGPVQGPTNHPGAFADAGATTFQSNAYCAATIDAAGNPVCNDANANIGGGALAVVGAGVANVNLFSFGGIANLDDDATFDSWTIDQSKRFTQVTDDITN